MQARSASEVGSPQTHQVVLGRRINPVLPTLLGAACISSSAIVSRLADTSPGTTSFYRCVLALPILVALSAFERRRLGPRPLPSRSIAALGGMFLGIDLVLWTHAIYDVGAGIATVLANLQVLFVTVIAWAVMRERPRLQFVAALPVVLFGVVLLAGVASSTGPNFHPLSGVLYGLSASVCYSVFILVFRSSTQRSAHVAGPLSDATAGAAVAAVLVGFLVGPMRFSVSAHALGWLVVLALTSQTLGWLLITSSLPCLPAALSSLLLPFQPAASLGLAALVLSQRPSVLQLLGALLVCGGVVMAARSRTPNAVHRAPRPDRSVVRQ
jgi:drug/metabolite transporter (DMT)-like permease